MSSSNRRKSVRKCVLDVEISPALEKRIRARIVKDRNDLKSLIDEHKAKRREMKSKSKLDPKSLGDGPLKERILTLEKLRANLLRLISTKGETYCRRLKKSDDFRLEQLRKEVEQENMSRLESVDSLLVHGLNGFSSNVKDIIERINRHKEDYDKRGPAPPADP